MAWHTTSSLGSKSERKGKIMAQRTASSVGSEILAQDNS